jgi:NADH-quinone oxidoreductase subunit J
MWLLLPHGRPRARVFGALLAAAGLSLYFTQIPRLEHWLGESLFLILAGITVVSAVATVTMRSPVYCAIWFGMSLLGTAGLMMYQGAQFLAMSIVVVYAGAILVTFLFVLMLAQPEGKAAYDRMSFEALLSATTGAVLVGVLSIALYGALAHRTAGDPLPPPSAAELQAGVLDEQHVARLGSELFGRHLLAVQVAGVLLMAALVGAAAIVTPRLPHHGKRATVKQASGEPPR